MNIRIIDLRNNNSQVLGNLRQLSIINLGETHSQIQPIQRSVDYIDIYIYIQLYTYTYLYISKNIEHIYPNLLAIELNYTCT